MRDAFFIVFVNNFEWFPVNFMPFNIVPIRENTVGS